MAGGWVKLPEGGYGRYDDPAIYKQVVEQLGYKPASDAEVAESKRLHDRAEEESKKPLQTAAEQTLVGGVDMLTAPARAAGGLLETVAGPNAVSSTLGQATGENALRAASSIALDPLARQSQAENDAAVADYMEGVNLRKAGSPGAAFGGNLAGGAAGFGPVAKVAAALGPAGQGIGAVTARGAIEGAQIGLATAEDQAHAENSYLKGDRAFASAGLGALLAGTLSFVGKGAADLWAKRQAAEAATTGEGGFLADLGPGDTLEPKRFPTIDEDTGAPRYGEKFDKNRLNKADLIDVGGKGPGPLEDYAPVKPLEHTPAEPKQFPFEYEPESTDLSKAPLIDMSEHVGGRAKSKLEMSELPDFTSKGAAEDAFNDVAMPHMRDTGDIGGDLRYGLAAEGKHMGARNAKVRQLLDAIPEGATPEYVLSMTPEQRSNFSAYVLGHDSKGRPIEISDLTLKALADAVHDREATAMPLPSPEAGQLPAMQSGAALPPPNPADFEALQRQNLPDLTGNPARQGMNMPGMLTQNDNIVPEQIPLGQPEGPTMNPPSVGEFAPKPEQDLLQGTARKPVLGAPDVQEFTPGRITSVDQWESFMRMVGSHVVRGVGRRVAGKMFGPMGYAASHLAFAAYDKMAAMSGSLEKIADSAIPSAIRIAEGLPPSVKSSMIGMGVDKAFYQKDNPEQAYTKRLEELHNANANDGQLLRDRIAQAFGPVAHTEPHAVLAVTESAQRGIDYLLAKAPTAQPNETSLTPLASRAMPNRSDIDAYAKIYTAVMYPKTVLGSIANGTVTKDEIDAIKYVHPQWYQDHIVNPAVRTATKMDMAGEPFPPAVRRVMDVILGINSGVESDQFVKQYADKFTQAIGQQAAPQPPPSGRRLGRASSIPQNYMTQTSKFLGNTQ